ncbi:MAG TPA: HlyD family efflux transporter periplasmic adaptor subunit [Usitatibacteraceae bacterium]
MNTSVNNPGSTADAPNPRKKLLIALSLFFGTAAVVYGIFWFVHARNFESTDNAYVQGNIVQITPQITGTVIGIGAQDTDFVKAGQTLIKLDPADAQVALDQADAQLGATVREVRTLYANNGALAANVTLRDADLARTASDVKRAEDDLTRRQSLVASGAVSGEELQHAQTALATARSAQAVAQAAAAAAREQLVSNKSLTEGVAVEQHPNVLRAAGRVREAYLAYKRAELPAPVTGFIAKRSVQVGQRIQPGAPLMAIVPLNEVWVDANFKEVQLRSMRIGQPVKLVADIYGGKVEFDGKIAGLGAGTGAAFALLPAQNATGNWIKVVQRVPVRIALDAKQLAEHPLRIGLSMEVEVDVRDQSGKALADAGSTPSVSETKVFTQIDQEADALVNKIVAANLGLRAVSVKPLVAQVGKSSALSAKTTRKHQPRMS